MNHPEATKEWIDILLDSSDEILATKKLFEIHPVDQTLPREDALAVERIIAGNFNYLTEKGKMSRDEYYALFEKCEGKQDFAELAVITHDFLIEQARKYLEEHPDLPEEGDAINPGKGNIESGIMWDEEGRASIQDRSKKGRKIPIIEIGEPSLRETPDWLLVVEEQELEMSEVYNLL